MIVSKQFPSIPTCTSEHNNIFFHSWISGGIRNSGPGSWSMCVRGACPLISFSQCIPLTWRYPIWAWPVLRRRAIRKRQKKRERKRQWGVLVVVQDGGKEVWEGAVGSKLKGLLGWLLLWNVPIAAKTRPPTAACYRQVHGKARRVVGERVIEKPRWWRGKQTDRQEYQ